MRVAAATVAVNESNREDRKKERRKRRTRREPTEQATDHLEPSSILLIAVTCGGDRGFPSLPVAGLPRRGGRAGSSPILWATGPVIAFEVTKTE